MNQKTREVSALALLVLGAAVVLKAVLPVRLPLVRLALGAALVWAGASLLSGRSLSLGGEERREERAPEGCPEWRCSLGKRTVDLTNTDEMPQAVRVSALLGTVTVRLPVDAAATVSAHTLCGLMALPGEKCLVLGERSYSCGSRADSAPKLLVEARCVLGRVRFIMG